MNRDLTKGNPSTELVKFSLPLLGSMIFQQLYNIADSFVAGKFIHENALAAVGNSYEITLIYIAFAFGCNMGCSVIVSNLFGGKRYSEMKTAVSTTFIASGILCAILMAVGLLFGRNMLTLIRTPDAIRWDFCSFSSIILQQAYFLRWEIPEHHLYYWRVHLRLTYLLIFCLLRNFRWGLPVLAGQHSCVRE